MRRAATVAVGAEPVGLAITDDERWVVVANSNRSPPKSGSSLAIIDARAATGQQAALHAYAPAGGFPREITTRPHANTLLVTNYNSQQVELVDMTNLR